MASAMLGALGCTCLLLMATAYFLMGGLPLLILRHDVPMDARFVRSFFLLYYRLAFWAATGACLCYALWGRYEFAAAAAAVAGGMVLLRTYLLGAMQRLGSSIEMGSEGTAIRRFRRVHATALLVNVGLLVAMVWGLYRLSLQLTPV